MLSINIENLTNHNVAILKQEKRKHNGFPKTWHLLVKRRGGNYHEKKEFVGHGNSNNDGICNNVFIGGYGNGLCCGSIGTRGYRSSYI